MQIFTYFILGLTLAIPVGPLNVEIMRRGFKEGFLNSWLVGLGGMTADIGFMAGAIYGLPHLMQNAAVRLSIHLSGLVLLVYLGILSLKASPIEIGMSDSRAAPKRSRAYLSGLVIAGFNPINFVFWASIFGTVAIGSESTLMMLLFKCAAIFFGLFIWNLFLITLIHFGRRAMSGVMLARLTQVAGGFMILFAVKIGWQLFH